MLHSKCRQICGRQHHGVLFCTRAVTCSSTRSIHIDEQRPARLRELCWRRLCAGCYEFLFWNRTRVQFVGSLRPVYALAVLTCQCQPHWHAGEWVSELVGEKTEGASRAEGAEQGRGSALHLQAQRGFQGAERLQSQEQQSYMQQRAREKRAKSQCFRSSIHSKLHSPRYWPWLRARNRNL